MGQFDLMQAYLCHPPVGQASSLSSHRLEAWIQAAEIAGGKRLVKSPKLYVRDSGSSMHCLELPTTMHLPVIRLSVQAGKAS